MNYKLYNDYELLYMIKESDIYSYNTLFNKYMPILKSLAYSYYSKYSNYGYELDDFQQEAFIAFNAAVNKYDENKNILFYSFVLLCVKRALLTFCKRITCEKKNISNAYLVNYEENIVAEESNIDSYFNYYHYSNIIKNVCLNVDFDDSCILELRYNGFSYKEISILLDLPLRHVQFVGGKLYKIIKDSE